MNEPTNETTNEPSNAKERAKPWMYLADTYAIVSFVPVCVCVRRLWMTLSLIFVEILWLRLLNE